MVHGEHLRIRDREKRQKVPENGSTVFAMCKQGYIALALFRDGETAPARARHSAVRRKSLRIPSGVKPEGGKIVTRGL